MKRGTDNKSMAETTHKRVPLFAAIATLCVFLVASLLVVSLWGFVRQGGVPAVESWSAKPIANAWMVATVDTNGPAAGKLNPGDRILSINGSNSAAEFGPSLELTKPSASYKIEVDRKGKMFRYQLPVWHGAAYPAHYIVFILLSLLFFIVAIWIAMARPNYRTAQVAFFVFLAGAIVFASQTVQAFPPPLPATWLAVALMLGSTAWRPIDWALLFDFSVRFPDSKEPRRLLRLTRIGFYVFAFAASLLSLLPQFAQILHLQSRAALMPAWCPLATIDAWRTVVSESFSAIALLASLAVLTAKYRKVPDPSARARLRWVAFGIGIALTPTAFRMLLDMLLRMLGQVALANQTADLLDPIVSCFSVFVPVTFLYAIVKHRVMGIRFALRRGLQYLLAKNVLRVIWYLPLIGIAVTIALHPREPLQEFILNESWWYYALLFISISLTLRYRASIESWVDKKFFRSVYEEELILSELLEELHECDVSDDVARVVASKLENALNPNGAAVLYRRDESSKFTVGYAHDAPFALQFCGETGSGLEFAQVDQRDAMVVPIKSPNGQITAALLLGPKKSEEKYSNRDFRLLQAVATQTGLILEVMALKERVREEGRVRVEVLAKLDKESIQLLMECPTCGLCYSGAETNCRADGHKLVLTLPIERVIDSKYRLDRRIGAGAMGAVYEATDLRLSRHVAVKVLTGRWFGDSVALRRFEREARAAARLQHPNIVPVYDFGSLRGDGAFLVMQRIRGHSWRAELERSGPLSIQRAASWFHQLGDALVAAHASGIVHRDLKPENLLVSTNDNGSETVTVLDFGLAKINALDLPTDRLTMENGIVGTIAYMSPEQRAGDRVDARSDIYSCAVVVVEALSGNGPTQLGASQRWLRESLVWSHPTPPCYQLLRLLHHSLATSPADRLDSMQRFQRELVPLLKECPPLSIAKAAVVGKTDGITLPM
jgi:hypothetical protein